MNRHTQKLLEKAKTHIVILDDPHYARYKVISGAKIKEGGKEYTVNVFGNGGASCNCNWATKRTEQLIENKGSTACSHTIAVFEFIAEGAGKRVSAWASPEQAERQHRPIEDMKDGVVLTLRQMPKRYTQSDFFFLLRR